MDYISVMPLSPRLGAAVAAAARGERAQFPERLEEQEIRALGEHGLLPLVYRWSRLPELRAGAMQAAAVEPLLLADLEEILAALHARGVEALILKGAALAYDLYEHPEDRPRTDVDLLIDAASIDAARAAFHDLGADDRLTSGDELGVRQQQFIRTDRFGLEHAYDVHWAIANSAVFADALRFHDLRARAVPLPRIGPHARGLSRVDALLMACIHRVAHHHDSERLVWLYDIHLLRARMSREEHRAFWERAAEGRVVGVCARSIEATDEWLGTTPHDGAGEYLDRETLAREEPSRAYLDREQRRGSVMLAELAALPGWRARLRRLRQLAFPPSQFVLQEFGARTRLALPWLYAWRGARGVARLFRRVA